MKLAQKVEDGEVRKIFDQILNERGDDGILQTITAWLFEPLNPFDSKRQRKPKPEVLILAAYLGLMGLTFAAFNLW
jgi:hypothetical protein